MGLHTWNQPIDPYDYVALTNNWQIVDFHDHSPGRGVQIPMSGIAAGAVGPVQLAATVPFVPTGGMVVWAGAVVPTGYVYCDGTAYQQSLYNALFAAIGTAFNNAPPTGYFNVPNITAGGPIATPGSVRYIIKT